MNSADALNLQFTMAGSGTPFRVLTPLRQRLLRALYDDQTPAQISSQFGLTMSELERELAPLVAAHLACREDGWYTPTIFIANGTETRRVADHAAKTGLLLADCLQAQWGEIEQVYRQLTISRRQTLDQTAFFLIGDLILDIGMLDALAQDSKLMPGAPARPAPDNPTARYYLYMTEGSADDLGWYGQHSLALPSPDWFLVSFGRYHINEEFNPARQAWTLNAQNLLQNLPDLAPEVLAERLGILLLNEADARCWAACVQVQTCRLLQFWHSQQPELTELYTSLKASAFAPYGFGEFFCWYDHVAFAAAIDALAAAGRLFIPEAQFTAAVYYQIPVPNGWLEPD